METGTIWIACGLVLALAEFLMPGFVAIFFGAGAILAGCAALLFPGLPMICQIALFSIFSVSSLLLFRCHAIGRGKIKKAPPKADYDEDVIGRTASVCESVSPGRIGKVELDGTNWDAVSRDELFGGDRVRVTDRDGLLLTVERLPAAVSK